MKKPLIVAPVAPTVGNVTCGYVVCLPMFVGLSARAPHVAAASVCLAYDVYVVSVMFANA
jgi:hypothetical protein